MRPFSAGLLVLALLACQGTPPPTRLAEGLDPVNASLDTASAYRTAIADYIHAMDTSMAPLPDTVYIGRHIEFPLIELPGVIAKRTVRLVDPGEGESEQHHALFAYLNIFTTYAPGKVEFYVVRFEQGLRHRPDGDEDRHLHYRLENDELVLEQVSR